MRMMLSVCGLRMTLCVQDFQLGVGMTYVSMEVASVKPTGRHSFSLITPYKTFKYGLLSTAISLAVNLSLYLFISLLLSFSIYLSSSLLPPSIPFSFYLTFSPSSSFPPSLYISSPNLNGLIKQTTLIDVLKASNQQTWCFPSDQSLGRKSPKVLFLSSFSADSSRDLAVWVDCLGNVIRSALSCSQVALQLWASPWNKVCADCGSASPEWASVNLLAVICEECAGRWFI